MASPQGAPPPLPPPPRGRPRSRSTYRQVESFVRDYTAGLDQRELRRLWDREAPRVYSVLTRDRDLAARPKGGWRRWWWDARTLFLSVSAKLSPGRRLIFAGSLIAALIGFTGFEFRYDQSGVDLRFDGSPLLFFLAIAGLLYLLASELVDRVLVRDELEVARALQRELLPRAAPSVPGWRFAYSLRTANDIGGDYLRFEPLADGRLAVVVADASGHGMAAGLLMAITDTALRIGLEQDPDPDAVARLLHRAVLRAGDRRSFVTVCCGLLDPVSGRLALVGAGHPSPLVRRADGAVDEPLAGSLPLGLRERWEPQRALVELAVGEVMVIVTDGAFEALDAAGRSFGWERLRQLVAAGGSAEALHLRIRDAIGAHVGAEPLSDDCTILVIERAG